MPAGKPLVLLEVSLTSGDELGAAGLAEKGWASHPLEPLSTPGTFPDTGVGAREGLHSYRSPFSAPCDPGRKANEKERQAALQVAEGFISRMQYAPNTQVSRRLGSHIGRPNTQDSWV